MASLDDVLILNKIIFGHERWVPEDRALLAEKNVSQLVDDINTSLTPRIRELMDENRQLHTQLIDQMIIV